MNTLSNLTGLLTELVTEPDYEAALHEAAAYFDSPPLLGSAAANRFDALLTLIGNYEAIHYPITPPDSVLQALPRQSDR